MNLGELKPLLTALILPPSSPLLLVLLGLALAWPCQRPRKAARLGAVLSLAGVALLWLLSCHAVAVWLSRQALPQVAALPPQAAATLKEHEAQAIVVLGGGVFPQAPEYGEAQLGHHSAARLRYGMHLARVSGLPLAFAGGVGWGASGLTGQLAEAEVARRVAEEAGLRIRWLDQRSRDTAENAQRMADLLLPQGVRRIALVTDAWHLPRSIRAFEKVGLQVLPAPTGFIGPESSPLLEWMPSARGLSDSRQILREWLGLRVAP